MRHSLFSLLVLLCCCFSALAMPGIVLSALIQHKLAANAAAPDPALYQNQPGPSSIAPGPSPITPGLSSITPASADSSLKISTSPAMGKNELVTKGGVYRVEPGSFVARLKSDENGLKPEYVLCYRKHDNTVSDFAALYGTQMRLFSTVDLSMRIKVDGEEKTYNVYTGSTFIPNEARNPPEGWKDWRLPQVATVTSDEVSNKVVAAMLRADMMAKTSEKKMMQRHRTGVESD